MTADEFATDLILGRVPYRARGRDRSGLDCMGLVLLAYRQRGIDLPDEAEPAAYDGLFREVHTQDRQPWDVLRFRLDNGQADHIALVLNKDTAFHYSDRSGTHRLHRFKIPPLAGKWRFDVLRYTGGSHSA